MEIETAVIFDLEGTLSNDRHRDHLKVCSGGSGTLAEWHRAICNDTPNESIITMFNMYHEDPNVVVIICTGKEEAYRNEAVGWLKRNVRTYTELSVPLLMRPKMDKRSSPDLKRSQVEEIRGNGLNPILAIDDRLDVCKMYKSENIAAIHYLKETRI